MSTIAQKEFTSSNIRSAGYDAESNKLAITFQSGKTYEYANVPENIFADMCHADSAGKFFAEHVKGQYTYKPVSEGGNGAQS